MGSRLLVNVSVMTYINKRTNKVKEKQEEKTIATQEDALKALSEMINAGFATQATSKKIRRTETDEEGNAIIVEETTSSIKPSDMAKAIELMARLQGWDAKVDKEDKVTIIDDLPSEDYED